MDAFNIYLTGVGGQGIGLISEILLRAGDYAGFRAIGVDTHGLAQRGGIVVSQLRLGDNVHSPLIRANRANLVVALERHEALRGMNIALMDGGTLVYYNTVWQPLTVRLNQSREVSPEQIETQCGLRNIRLYKVFDSELEDIRMQNIVVLGIIDRRNLIPGIKSAHYRLAMQDLMSDNMLKKNLAVLDRVRGDTP